MIERRVLEIVLKLYFIYYATLHCQNVCRKKYSLSPTFLKKRVRQLLARSEIVTEFKFQSSHLKT